MSGLPYWSRRIEIPEEDAIALLRGSDRCIVRYHGTRRTMNMEVVDIGDGQVYFVEDELSRTKPKKSWRCATLEEALKTMHEHGDYYSEEEEQ